MAIKLGTGGHIKIGTASGSVALVASVKSMTVEHTNDVIDITTLGQAAVGGLVGHQYMAGLENSTISVECFWDEADAEQILLVPGSTLFFEVYPSGADEAYYTGNGCVTSSSITVNADALVDASFSLNVNGVLTRVAN